MRIPKIASALSALLAITASVHAGNAIPGYADTLAVGGLSIPTAIAFLPDGRLLIAEKGGALKLQTGATATTLVTIPVCSASEMGLLGIALDPDFGTNGYIYLYRTENAGGCGSSAGRSNEVVRVTMTPSDTISIGSLTVLLTGIRTDDGNHDGGVLRIGLDNKLYVGVGDTGNGDNIGCPGTASNPYAQDLGALEGKILRLNLDGTAPADNPFVGVVGARPEVFARGFRNPFRMGIDPQNGNVWVGDVGDFAFEEIDIVGAGQNFGWPQCEAGNHPAGCALGGEINPIYFYSHGGSCPGEGSAPPSLGNSITGGTFVGTGFGAVPDFDYVFGDYTGGGLYHARVNAGRTGIIGDPTPLVTFAGGPVDIITGPDGFIYYVAIFDAEVRQLRPTAPASDQLLLGSKMTLATNADPAKRSASFSSKDIGINLGDGNTSADDPVVNGGSIRIVTTDGCSGPCDTTYPLTQSPPNAVWSYVGAAGDNKGYKFKSKVPAIRATVRNGKLVRVTMKGALGHDLLANPQPVDARLTVGGHNYCVRFGGTTAFTANKKFTAKISSPPANCLP